ncbi:amidohydrolase [Piscinibacter sakaiensis]|uniref:Exoenzymes regulatory protein AepA n=1 Tax=Piscinibacter sakaiensis TaxID=1547922 RepID=A0A0K8NZI8_PISS1|nr:amidohydrolase [Piscinibacter sakaiensis]GAP35793.1 exoenzymes regulatory protein AepA [Piscinibacter sakaiensis]
MTSQTTVYVARKILTMNPRQPEATHVAVRDGRILAVGDRARMAAWGEHRVDERYADAVLMPGLVEGHSHLTAGGLAAFTYVGYHARPAPDGGQWAGCRDFAAVAERLRKADEALRQSGAAEDAPLLAWGFDPIFFGTERMTTEHLDPVSRRRPVVVLHASHHLMNVNTPALAAAGIDADSEIEGVARFPDGRPNGELQEFAAMFPVLKLVGNGFRAAGTSEQGLRLFGQLARRAGVTTATDLGNDPSDEGLATLVRVTGEDDYPLRLVTGSMSLTHGRTMQAQAELVRGRMALNHERLRFGIVKVFADGSIQGFSARLRWPGYFNGAPNGIWNLQPALLRETILHHHAQGLQMHIHTNGDEATEVTLDALEEALSRQPRPDHRHTLQHCQMADAAQYRRMARLGVCANLFVNHVYYWGEAHARLTMGPDRAERLDACRTALDHGVPLALHSDAPITPLGPLFSAWCAVNRLTSEGRVLGAAERIGVPEALRAITLGAAWTLKLDDRIGSIEVGKQADFCVLGEDPLAVDPVALKDLPVLGTVLAGRPTA